MKPSTEVMRNLAPYLGQEWLVYPYEDETVWVLQAPGYLFLATPDSGKRGYRPADKGRLLVQGYYSEFEGKDYFDSVLGGSESNPELRRPAITVSYLRGPMVVAKAIKRRLIPEYDQKAKAASYWYKTQVARQSMKDSYFQLLKAYGPPNEENERIPYRLYYKIAGSNEANCIVEVNPYDNTINIHISGLDLESALEALRSIGES